LGVDLRNRLLNDDDHREHVDRLRESFGESTDLGIAGKGEKFAIDNHCWPVAGVRAEYRLALH
jgi:hypothetical protein